MPLTILDNYGEPPAEFLAEYAALSTALDGAVPTRQLDRNLLVATWNIREFGGLQPSWQTDPAKSPKRNVADVHFIAEVLSRFDVIAIQELQTDLSALREVLRALGPDWALLTSDVTRGAKGQERIGFVYDVRRVRPTGLVGELVLSAEDLQKLYESRAVEPVPPNETEKQRKEREKRERDHRYGGQLDRTPYVASFTSASRPFMLASVHLVWGEDDNLDKRAEEARLLATMLADLVKPSPDELGAFHANLLALGDFNATAPGDPIIGALKAAGMVTAQELDDAPRTVSDTRDGQQPPPNTGDEIAYDQFAFFDRDLKQPAGASTLTLPRISGGSFPWDDYALIDEMKLWAKAQLAKKRHEPPPPGAYDPTYRISDHYPLWLELSVRR
jgi:endonuclease/exonuclease/phosphatase family metal-dependent hydrolase